MSRISIFSEDMNEQNQEAQKIPIRISFEKCMPRYKIA